MTPKDYFEKCRYLEDNIKEAQDEYEMLNATLLAAVQHKQDMVTSTPTSGIEDKYIELSKRNNKINQAIDDKVDYTLKVSAELDHMENNDYRRLLRDRYIVGKSWEQIAVDHRFDISWVYKLHGRALQEFERIYPDKFGEQAIKSH